MSNKKTLAQWNAHINEMAQEYGVHQRLKQDFLAEGRKIAALKKDDSTLSERFASLYGFPGEKSRGAAMDSYLRRNREDSEAEALTWFFPNLVDLDGIKAREDNILGINYVNNNPTNKGMTIMLANYLAEYGREVSATPDPYGSWKFEEESAKGKEIIGAFNLREDSWSECDGTFDGDNYITGIAGEFVFSDGTAGVYRWGGTLGELITRTLGKDD